MRDDDPSGKAAWVAHWRRVGSELEQIGREELRRFRYEEHAIALDDHWSFGARVFGQRIEVLDENDLSTAEGDGTTVGAQLGVRYKTDKFILAAAYTTRTNTKVEGSLKDIHPAATTLVPGDAEVDFLLPDRLQAGIAVPLRPNLWWEFDLDWIGWSYVDELTMARRASPA